MTDIGKYRLALEDAFGFPIAEATGVAATVLYEGNQRIRIRFDPDKETATISTPVDEAHDGLPPEILGQLLARNLPNRETAGAVLQLGDNGSHLELINVLPLAAIEPQTFTKIVLTQAAAAQTLSQSTLSQVRKLLSVTQGALR